MKRAKIVLALIVGIIFTSMTIHDLFPYHERNYVTQSGSFTRQYDIVLNLTTRVFDIEMNPFIDIHDPFPNTNVTYILSSSINVSLLLVSSENNIQLASTMNTGFIEPNTTVFIQTVFSQANRHSFHFFWYPYNLTKCSGQFSIGINYTLDILFIRPPKTYAWSSLLSVLNTEGVILIGVISLSSVLIYVGTKLLKQ